MIKNLFVLPALLFIVQSCSISPGMHFDAKSQSGEDYVYVKNLDKEVFLEDISSDSAFNENLATYRIGVGDQIAVTVWGLQEIFPIANMNPDQNLRRVDQNGNIYFPYVGEIKAYGKTQSELRNDLTVKLSAFFKEPQLDLSIARFNSQKIYLLGEVTRPMKINITDVPISLSDALGEANGISTNTASGSEVFIIRQGIDGANPRIFRADLSSPAGFITASNFYLENNDIIYVNASGTTRWNRIVSQFFPFSTFLNSVDNLTSD